MDYDRYLNDMAAWDLYDQGPEEDFEPFPDPYDVMIDMGIEDEAREVGK
jgi:hypothetical protein